MELEECWPPNNSNITLNSTPNGTPNGTSG
jgi:hypothetical protein